MYTHRSQRTYGMMRCWWCAGAQCACILREPSCSLHIRFNLLQFRNACFIVAPYSICPILFAMWKRTHSSFLLLFCPILARSRMHKQFGRRFGVVLVSCMIFFRSAMKLLRITCNSLMFFLHASYACAQSIYLPPKILQRRNENRKSRFWHTQRIWLLFFVSFFFLVFLIRSNKNPNWNSERPNNINFNTFNSYIFLFGV